MFLYNAVLLDFVVEGLSVYSEKHGGFAFIVVGLLESAYDSLLFLAFIVKLQR